MQQAIKAGLTAATISMVLKVAPEIFRAIDYLIKNGDIDKEQFKKIGFAALSGSAEGFVRGSVSGAITTCCKSGLLGVTFKGIDPTIIGTVTAITMNVVKNAYEVAIGNKTRSELTTELIQDMFVSACALTCGGTAQMFIEIPVVGYLIGSFVGSLVGAFVYNVGYIPGPNGSPTMYHVMIINSHRAVISPTVGAIIFNVPNIVTLSVFALFAFCRNASIMIK
jgi:hypothetical protein